MKARITIVRTALFFALWLMIAGYQLADVPIGLGAAALATWASLHLSPPGSLGLRPWSLVAFGVHFLGQSVRAGVEVAWLTLHPSMPIRPGFVTWRPRLESATARNAFCTVSSLLPGTLPAGSDDEGTLLIHCLDIDQPVADSLSSEEALFSRIISHD